MLALGYFDRTPLNTTDRDYTIGTGMSNLGSPGAFIPLGASTNPTYAAIQTAGANAGLPATTPIIDLDVKLLEAPMPLQHLLKPVTSITYLIPI